MTARLEWVARLVALTVFGAAAIVPALLARRMHDANGTLAEAESLRASVDRSEAPGSGAGGPLETSGALPNGAAAGSDAARLSPLGFETAFLAPPSSSPPNPVRFFSKNEIDQATTRVANRTPGIVLLPPLGLTATVADEGVVLTWTDNPGNPVGTIVRTQVVRWTGNDSPKPVFQSNPTPVQGNETGDAIAAQRRYLDPEPCQGARVSYAVLTVQLDRLEGVEVRRSVLGETVTAEVPVRYRVEPISFAAGADSEPTTTADRVVVSVEDLRKRPSAPLLLTVAVGDEIGNSAGSPTGWVLSAVERESRVETVETPVPVFGPDASRTVENGSPVFKTRVETKSIAYPILHLKNRCGTERVAHTAAHPNAKVSPR